MPKLCREATSLLISVIEVHNATTIIASEGSIIIIRYLGDTGGIARSRLRRSLPSISGTLVHLIRYSSRAYSATRSSVPSISSNPFGKSKQHNNNVNANSSRCATQHCLGQLAIRAQDQPVLDNHTAERASGTHHGRPIDLAKVDAQAGRVATFSCHKCS